MRRNILFLFYACFSFPSLLSGQGNMLPPIQFEKLLSQQDFPVEIEQVQAAVSKVNQNCSGVVISPDGLVLTAFHCIADYLPDSSWLTKGFWAKDLENEIPLPQLRLSIQRTQKELTPEILSGIPVNASPSERAQIINRNQIQLMLQHPRAKGTYHEVSTSDAGNHFELIEKQSYSRLRLVGFPAGQRLHKTVLPQTDEAILKDFALLRVEKDKAAELNFLQIAPTLADRSGELVFSAGFPVWSNNAISASELVYEVQQKLRIQSKLDSIALNELSNYLSEKHPKLLSLKQNIKEQKAQIEVLDQQKLIAQKKAQEISRMSQDKIGVNYQKTVQNLDNHYQSSKTLSQINEYATYTFSQLELWEFISFMAKLFSKKTLNEENFSSFKNNLILNKIQLLGVFDLQTVDRALFAEMAPYYFSNLKANQLSPKILELVRSTGKDYQKLADLLYHESILFQSDQMTSLLKESPLALAKALNNDFTYQFFNQLQINNKTRIQVPLQRQKRMEREFKRKHVQALKKFGPKHQDANGTLRFSPGVIQNIRMSPSKLQGKSLPTIILSNTHNSGGSSGAPLLNRKGQVTGIHIQRPSASILSDYLFNPTQHGSMALSMEWILSQLKEIPKAERIIQEINANN